MLKDPIINPWPQNRLKLPDSNNNMIILQKSRATIPLSNLKDILTSLKPVDASFEGPVLFLNIKGNHFTFFVQQLIFFSSLRYLNLREYFLGASSWEPFSEKRKRKNK